MKSCSHDGVLPLTAIVVDFTFCSFKVTYVWNLSAKENVQLINSMENILNLFLKYQKEIKNFRGINFLRNFTFLSFWLVSTNSESTLFVIFCN